MTAEGRSFRSWFQQRFGAPFPLELPRDPERTGCEGEHFSTDARDSLTPHALMVPAYPEAPDTYVVSGVWGHGLSRVAFYFIERITLPAGPFETYFRMSFESAYGGEPGEEIVAFLRGYAEWRASVADRLCAGRIEYSMGTGRYCLEYEGEPKREARMPLAENGAVLRPSAVWPILRARLDVS